VICQISDNSASLFSYLGARTDKHQRNHEIYAVLDRSALTGPPVGPMDLGFAPTQLVSFDNPAPASASWSASRALMSAPAI